MHGAAFLSVETSGNVAIQYPNSSICVIQIIEKGI
ncbi:MAG: hypothetical protein ACJAVS_000086 [Paracoccaceae bacterium]|jgi:hypothetical protein